MSRLDSITLSWLSSLLTARDAEGAATTCYGKSASWRQREAAVFDQCPMQATSSDIRVLGWKDANKLCQLEGLGTFGACKGVVLGVRVIMRQERVL